MEADKNSSTVDFLNEISTAPFTEEEVKEVEEEVAEKPLPFNKDPKVQRYIDRELDKRLKDFKPSAEQQFKEEVRGDVEDVIGAFTTIIGDDTPEKKRALEALKRTLQGADERASNKAIERFQQQMQEQEEQSRAEDAAALDELNAGFEAIEEEHGVDLTSDKKTRAEFITYLRRVSHKNSDGEVDQFADIPSAWETFSESRTKAPASRAKELASRGMTRSTDTTTTAPTGRSWKDVDRFFSKLKANND